MENMWKVNRSILIFKTLAAMGIHFNFMMSKVLWPVGFPGFDSSIYNVNINAAIYSLKC